jgi:hypothetical protein
MGFFDSLWGWADYEPKDRSEAAYKRAYASSAGMAEFFALFWGWADYTRVLDLYPMRRPALAR